MSRDAFIGRQTELRRLVQWLESPGDPRLLTVVGPGGMGKTRLVREALEASTHGTALIDLTRATDLAAVCTAVAGAIGVELDPSNPDPAAQLAHAIAAGVAPVLVVDNLEQVADDVAPAIARWLDVAPNVRILATSRQRLRIAGEQTLTLQPLGTDRPEDDACTLFVARAREVLEHDACVASEQIRQLVIALDGLPLAIELAVSRLRVLSVEALARSLACPFGLLGGGNRDVAERHRTMAATIAWSWDMLGSAERQTLCGCAAFEGAFDWPMARQLLGDDLGDHRLLDALSTLVDSSLLCRHGASAVGDGPQFELLRLIRLFGREQLEAQQVASEVYQRHAELFLQRLGPVVSPCWVHLDAARIGWLAQASADLLAVYRRCLDRQGFHRPDLALTVALGLGPLLDRQGALPHYRQLLDGALDGPREPAGPAAVDGSLIAAALNGRGFVKRRQGDLEGAWSDLSEALRLLDADEDPRSARLRVSVLGNLGAVASVQGDLSLALEQFTAASDLALEIGDEVQGAVVDACAGRARYLQGDWVEASAILTRCLEVHQRLGDRRAAARALARLGFFAQDQGELDGARRSYEQALEIAEAEGLLSHRGIVLTYLGNLERREGDTVRAEQRYVRAIDCLRRAGHREFEGVARMDLGIALLLADERAAAHEAFGEACAVLGQLGERRCWALSQSYLAVLAAIAGDHRRAADLQQQALAQIADPGELFHSTVVLNDWHRALAQARPLPGGEQRDAALAPVGQALADAEALGRPDHLWLAARILRRAFERVAPPPGALVVARDGRWLSMAGGPVSDVNRHQAPRRLLAALVAAHLRGGRGGLDRPALIAAGWPDEQVQHHAALNRLRVALSTLRRLGLAEALERGDDGFCRLRPELTIVVQEP